MELLRKHLYYKIQLILTVDMAKTSQKKLYYEFPSINIASFFLDYIKNKKLPVDLSIELKYDGKVVIKMIGNPENLKISISKLKNIYNIVSQKCQEVENENYDEEILEKEVDFILNQIEKEDIVKRKLSFKKF